MMIRNKKMSKPKTLAIAAIILGLAAPFIASSPSYAGGLVVIDGKHKKVKVKHKRRHVDVRYYNHRVTHRHYNTHRVGLRVNVLPRTHVTVRVGGGRYYYSSGVYYRPVGKRYVVVSAPVGARITALPFGYISFHAHGRPYYYVNHTYYVYEPANKTYVVVEKPEGTNEAQLTAASEAAEQRPATTEDLIVYPANGQSEEQLDQDRYECHRWASGETGFDPVTATDASGRNRYNRAMTACLKGRGYTVN